MRRQEITVSDEGQRASLLRFLMRLPLDKPLRVTIEERQRRRSHSQMGLYWMWLNEVAEKVADFTGHSPEEIHEVLKQKFLSPVPITIGGIEHFHYTTKKLSVQEMSAYLEQVYMFVTTELGIFVSLPEERFAA
jgi:hypothetical protein